MGRIALMLCLVGGTLELGAATVTKGYTTRLQLHGTLEPGPDQRIEGSGAPDGAGVYVELWRVAPGTGVAESVASVQAVGGAFSFEGVDVGEGESYYVTLSRSWNFRTDGDAEGWDALTEDVQLDVVDGALNVRIQGMDPHFFNFFEYDSNLYRVIEIRLLNPAAAAFPEGQDLSIFWGEFNGSGSASSANRHPAGIRSKATGFETILIPMNVDEIKAVPPPVERDVDGLWATGLQGALRIDPLDPVAVDGSPIGLDFKIDFIRIREDLRLDFHEVGDAMGLGASGDIADLSVGDGFLSYSVPEAPQADPFLQFTLPTGKIESGYFSRFVIGMDNLRIGEEPNSLSLLFNDDDSGAEYIDDDGTLQIAELASPLSGRQDLVMDLDERAGGEWSEDGAVPVDGLHLLAPGAATPGDQIRIDYLGFIPDNPYGPSEPLVAVRPNFPPIAVITSDPSPAEVPLEGGTARIILDGRQSDDGDGGTQELSFWWDVVSGPAAVIIDRPEEAVVEVVLCGAGEFGLRLTVSDGELTDAAEISVVVLSEKDETLRERIERWIERLRAKIAELEARIGRLKKCIAALEMRREELTGKLPLEDTCGLERMIRRIDAKIERTKTIIAWIRRKIEAREAVIAVLERLLA